MVYKKEKEIDTYSHTLMKNPEKLFEKLQDNEINKFKQELTFQLNLETKQYKPYWKEIINLFNEYEGNKELKEKYG